MATQAAPFRAPLWLWPNLLSLDATAVAVLWQHFLSESLTPVHPAATVVLGLSVWLVYTFDRQFDTLTPAKGDEAPRHRFARAYRKPLLLAAIPVLALDLAVALVYLPAAHLAAGLVLTAAVGARFAAMTPRPERPWAKEMWTALIFAAGVWTPILLTNPLRPGAVLFALLCWWNCAAIDSWEGDPGSRPLVRTALLMTVAAIVFFAWTHRPVALAEAISGAGFSLLALGASRLSADVRRVAVDVCLLTPLLLHGR